MQNYSSQDLQTTPNFALQKNVSFGGFQKAFKPNASVHKTLKTQSLFDEPFKCNHQNKLEQGLPEMQRQLTLHRTNGFSNEELANADQKKGNSSKYYGNCRSREQAENIIPSVLSESLQITSKLAEYSPPIKKQSTIAIKAQNTDFDHSHDNSSNVDIDLNFAGRLQSQEESFRQQRSALVKFSVSQQIAITYVPLKYANDGMKRPIMFQKFHKGFQEKQNDFSSKSLYSNLPYGQNNQLKDCMVNSTANFVKLHEVDLFMKRKEIRIERSDELLLANQKLLAGHLMVKQQLQKAKRSMEKLETYYKDKIEHIQHELAQQRQSKRQILVEKELKQSIIKNIKTLNEQYLKQNNELKEKLKMYIKNMHELKYQVTNKRTAQVHETKDSQNCYPRQQNTNKSIYVPLPTINSLPSNQDITDRSRMPPLNKKQVTLHHEEITLRNLQERRGAPNLNNCNSHAHIRGMNQRKLSSNDIVVEKYLTNACKNTKSQKSIIGIKRNNVSQQDSQANRNLVKINKNTGNDNSMIIKFGEDQRDRSISSYSNISGMSLSHKVGHILKPQPHESKKGIILDYMAQNHNKQQNEGNQNLQKFKYRRQGQ